MTTLPILYGIKRDIWDKILAILFTNPSTIEVVLFGSRAKGNFKPGSDIDLCVKGPTLTSKDITQFNMKLDLLDLPWTIDLIHFESIADADVTEHINRIGVKLGNW
jgi:uncharacterized protein